LPTSSRGDRTLALFELAQRVVERRIAQNP
jgi:hypothetical protein